MGAPCTSGRVSTRLGRGWRRFLALSGMLLVLGFSARSHAYCLTRTCDARTAQCELDEFGCNLSGNALFWPSSCVSFSVQQDGSKKLGIGYDTLQAVVTKAFQQWTDADCGGGAHPSIQIVDGGMVSCAKPEYNQSQPNAHIIAFHDSKWLYTNTMETVALTTVHFNRETGEIYDADVEINSDQNDFADSDPAPGQIDLNAALTHEAGHFLGLSHSGDMTATMYWAYSADAATLESDDVTAICTSLPPDRTPVSTDCTPRHGFSGDCATAEAGCCATAVGRNGSAPRTLGLLTFGLGVGLWRSRSASRRRR
jgi:Matrixin